MHRGRSRGRRAQWLAPFDVAPGDEAASQPTVAFGPTGDLALAWASAQGGSGSVAQARRAPGGTFAGAPTLGGASDPIIAAAPDGTIYLAWTTIDLARAGEGAVNVGRLAADGTVAEQAVVSGLDDASTPALDVAADGRLGVAWMANDAGGDGTVRAAVGPIGSFSPVSSVSVADNNAGDPAVAFDAGGILHVAWSRLAAAETGRIKIATVNAAGVASAALAVSPVTADAGDPPWQPTPPSAWRSPGARSTAPKPGPSTSPSRWAPAFQSRTRPQSAVATQALPSWRSRRPARCAWPGSTPTASTTAARWWPRSTAGSSRPRRPSSPAAMT